MVPPASHKSISTNHPNHANQFLHSGTLFVASTADSAIAQAARELSPTERKFVEETYPTFRAVQCHLCHNDNGVASDYEIQFPPSNSSREQILAFGYQLSDYVDRAHPESSLLLLKPTGRVEHTGGERIKPLSAESRA